LSLTEQGHWSLCQRLNQHDMPISLVTNR
jgi:hypothetical protein